MIKLIKVIKNTILIFIISSIFHFIYELIPNNLTASLFPVNESIWEHFKLIYISSLFFSLIKFLSKKEGSLFSTLLRSSLLVLILSLIYIPIYYSIGENIIITLLILFISIFLTELLVKDTYTNKTKNIISFFIIVSTTISFIYLTFNPIEQDLFLDHKTNTYGLNK